MKGLQGAPKIEVHEREILDERAKQAEFLRLQVRQRSEVFRAHSLDFGRDRVRLLVWVILLAGPLPRPSIALALLGFLAQYRKKINGRRPMRNDGLR